jgi:hypothetical protein
VALKFFDTESVSKFGGKTFGLKSSSMRAKFVKKSLDILVAVKLCRVSKQMCDNHRNGSNWGLKGEQGAK